MIRADGGKKCKGVKKDRSGRVIKLKTSYENIKTEIIVPDIEKFKTTQLQIQGWVIIDPELEQEEVNRILYLTKRQIKQTITNFARYTGKYQVENIVIVDTGKLKNKPNSSAWQFMTIDITLYNKKDYYDRDITKRYMLPLVNDIIENCLNNEQVFNFIKKSRKDIYE